MNHFATPEFWHCYRQFPAGIGEWADKNFALLRNDPRHPSSRLKKSERFGRHASGCSIAHERLEKRLVWFWIGHHHAEYDRFLKAKDRTFNIGGTEMRLLLAQR